MLSSRHVIYWLSLLWYELVSSYTALMRASGNQMFEMKSHANRPCTSYSVHQLSDGVLGLARTVTLRTRSIELHNDLRSIKSDCPS